MSIITPNQIKQALKEGQSVLGTMVVEMRQPSVTQLLKNAGYDFIIIDNEHGPYNIETIADLSRAAKQIGLTPLVRVPDLFYPFLAQSLDSGAQGVMVPRIFNVDQVHEAVQIMRYPPVGRRGCALARGFTDFKSGAVVEAMADANQQNMLIIQIETAEAIDNVDEIAAVPGVDVLLVGPTDLSIALGVAGQLDSPVLHGAIEKVIAACQKNNIVPGLHINSIEWGTHWAKKGMRLLSLFSEAGLLTRGGLDITSAMKKAF